MTNIKFPNFDFDKWMSNYIYLLENFEKEPDVFINQFTNDSELYYELKDNFYAQSHVAEANETWNYTFQYLHYLGHFTRFMNLIMNECPVLGKPEIFNIIYHFINTKYPNKRMTIPICQYLVKGKSYRINKNLIFTPKIITNIEFFLKELNIQL